MMRAFVQGLLKQIQIVRALVLREMKTRFGRHKLGYLWALFEPITWVIFFAGMSVLVGRTAPGGMPIIPFLSAGILPFLFFRSTSSSTTSAIAGNRGLLVFPDIRPLDLVAARVALEFSTNLVVFFLIVCGVGLWQGAFMMASPMLILQGLLLGTGLGAGLGLTLCGLTTFSASVQPLSSAVLRPMLWISGIFFSINELPLQARHLLLWNPVLHVVETVRMGWIPGYHAHGVNAVYPTFCILVLLFFGLTLERVARRRWDAI